MLASEPYPWQCNMAYHHLASINDTTTMLASFLAPGGKLLVVDLMPTKHETSEDPMFEEKYHAMVAHRHGFDEATMRAAFEGAMLEKFTYDKITDVNWDGKALEVFLAKYGFEEKLRGDGESAGHILYPISMYVIRPCSPVY
jgi:hypothetical protein